MLGSAGGESLKCSFTPPIVGLYSSLFAVENAVEESPGVGRKVIVRITPYAAHEAW